MNVLFLMTDQHRVDTLGCYGNPHVATPNLDRLAATGARFDRCYTPTAICTPARASLLTGQAPFRHQLLANYERNVGYLEDLRDGAFTFPAALSTETEHAPNDAFAALSAPKASFGALSDDHAATQNV